MGERSEGDVVSKDKDAEVTSEKKPYSPPTLRRLGTVRELTLTGGKTQTEGARGHKPM